MQEIFFTVPVTGKITVSDGSVVITVNKAETTINFESVPGKEDRISLEKGKTLFDVVLEVARKVAEESETGQFSAAQLYYEALQRYPNLKRNSFNSHVIASSPNHSSFKHYASKRDYLNYTGNGLYRLNPKYKILQSGINY
jgi:hypothetical protein